MSTHDLLLQSTRPRYMQDDLQRILERRHHDPFQYLGVHFTGSAPEMVTIRTFQPQAREVALLAGGQSVPMLLTHEAGLYTIELPRDWFPDPGLDPYTYQFRLQLPDGATTTINDPYRFLPQLDETDRYLFNFGTNYRLYDHLGCHVVELSAIRGSLFRVWAPNAVNVSVIGDFNSWDGRVHQMRSLGASGIWELFLPGVTEGSLYKFQLLTRQGEIFDKSDPFQFSGELRPKSASVVTSLQAHQWQDREWFARKKDLSPYNGPLTIYEVHLGSWCRDPANPDAFLNYRQIADKLVPYVKELGFTHIELLPLMEHPLDESWGYQVTGSFSVTSRYGSPGDFMYFVDLCHQYGIGVILDWVPAHFPKDQHSLARFDGSALYEHADPRLGDHPEWGTFIYNYGRREVSNFLIASALFWLDHYHIDGLRVDAVASMLYLDYSRREGEWLPNQYGGRENLEAIEFLRHANSVIYDLHPETLMIAEESTSFYGVSKATDQGGLGFGFKWNMGWMNDILSYFEKDPLYRKYHHNALTFSLMYAFSENFVLPLSHDEVVHGKRSLLSKMPGDTWQKFANLRLLLSFMWLHPGKKLLFMGGEFGQWHEWYCKRSLDWHLLDDNPLHRQLQRFVADLNGMYLANPAAWEQDFHYEGFSWLDFEDRNNSIISFSRHGLNRDDHLVAVFNFTPEPHVGYTIGLPANREYSVILNSNQPEYGGSGRDDNEVIVARDTPHGAAGWSAEITIPPLAGLVLKPCRR